MDRAIDNLWDDIPGLGTTPGEDVGYPTQKTEALLRRIIAASTQPVSSWLSDEVMRRWFVGSVAGVDILTTADISVNANDDAYCGMFSPVAMAIDMRRALRLEDERDASRRGIELNMTAVYAYGVWRPAMGITGLFDASTPTS